MLMNLKSQDSEVDGNSIFDAFCLKNINYAFNSAKISEKSLKDVQIEQYLFSIHFCGLKKKEELSKAVKVKYLRAQAALSVGKMFQSAMVFNKMKSGQQIDAQS